VDPRVQCQFMTSCICNELPLNSSHATITFQHLRQARVTRPNTSIMSRPCAVRRISESAAPAESGMVREVASMLQAKSQTPPPVSVEDHCCSEKTKEAAVAPDTSQQIVPSRNRTEPTEESKSKKRQTPSPATVPSKKRKILVSYYHIDQVGLFLNFRINCREKTGCLMTMPSHKPQDARLGSYSLSHWPNVSYAQTHYHLAGECLLPSWANKPLIFFYHDHQFVHSESPCSRFFINYASENHMWIGEGDDYSPLLANNNLYPKFNIDTPPSLF
jgi:hypothetical protein